MHHYLFTLLLLLGPVCLVGQKTVSGTVVDNQGQPLIGATVIITGTSRGTATDVEGNYELKAAPTDSLQISYTGYGSVIAAVGTRTVIDFTLSTDVELLDKVIVIGYGSVKKSDVTGAVSSWNPTLEEASQFTDVQSLLQGRIAGVQVLSTGGEPGSPLSLRIRGANSLRGDNEPLYVVDGIIINSSTEDAADPLQGGSSYLAAQNGLTGISPQDIESIEILKDASATAIYGSRGANGVVLITTKQSKGGKPKFTYNSSVRVGEATRLIDVLDPLEYINYQNDARAALEFAPRFYTYEDGTIAGYVNSPEFMEANAESLPRLTPVNWFDDILQTSVSHSHRLSIAGGEGKGRYYVAGGFMNNQGIIPSTKLSTGDLLFKYDRKVNDRFKYSGRASLAFVSNQASKGTENLGSSNASLIRQVTLSAPLLGYSENNILEDPAETLDGPRAWLSDYNDDSREQRALVAFTADYKLSDVFTYRIRFGGDYRNKERNLWYGLGLQRGLQSNGEAGESILSRLRYNVDNTLMFKKQLARGQRLNGTIGVVWDATQLDQETFTASDFPNPELRFEGLEQGRAATPRVFDSRDEQLLSFLGRTNYSYKNRYLATLSFRADGTSKFAPSNKFSFFPAIALAWKVNNEKFLREQNFISDAKVRVGYGLTGSQAIRPYQTLARYGPTGSLQSDANGNPLPTQRPLNLANESLRWETTRQLNAGIDFGILNDRVTATFDAYHKVTSDLLQQLNVGPSSGFSTITVNRGELENYGVEFSLSAAVLTGKFKWNVFGNISRNRNRIRNLGLAESQFGTERFAAFLGRRVSGGTFFKVPANIFIEGRPAGLFWGFETNGIVANTADLEIAPDVQGLETQLGDVFYVDQNGDGNITDADLTVIGDPNPDFTYGFGSNFAYGAFTLNLLFNGVQGNDIANGNLSRSGFARGLNDNILRDAYLEAWTPENPEGTYPRLNYVNPGDFPDRFIEDGSFLRLSFVSLGYNLPPNTIRGITNAQLFISGQNLFVISDYSGFDPEVDSFSFDPTRRGIDWSSFPRLRSYTLGLTVAF